MVGSESLDARLEVPARHVDGARDVALAPLVLLADVDEDARAEELLGARSVHLLDLGTDLLEQFPVGWHDFP